MILFKRDVRVSTQILLYQAEAVTNRKLVAAQRDALVQERHDASRETREAAQRAAVDDLRVFNARRGLREAQMRNHFTDRMRVALGRVDHV